MKIRRFILVTVFLGLSACGGSGDSSDSPADLDASPDASPDATPAEDISVSGDQISGVDKWAPDAATPVPDTASTPDTTPGTDGVYFDGIAPCQSDEDYFAEALWAPTLSVKCIVCHSAAGIAKNSEMVLQGADTPGFMEANFETVKAIALKNIGDQSMLLAKPTMTHPMGHTGGKQLELNSVAYLKFEHFVKRMKGEVDACELPEAPDANPCESIPVGRPSARRLSHVEYDNTIETLFGFDSVWAAGLTVDNLVHGFDNNTAALHVSPLLGDQYRNAAEEIAAEAMKSPQQLIPCSWASGQELQCAEEFIQDFGARVFRRPLTEDDVTRYMAVYNPVANEDGFEEGIRWVLTAMLQSPHFLYRQEIGTHLGEGEHELTAYEIASQLSYFIWNTMPDEELFAKAADESLLKSATILQQAKRLLANPQSHDMLAHFSRQWLDITSLGNTPKNAEIYPQYNTGVRHAMTEETAHFVTHVVFNGSGSLPELFTAKYTLTNQVLAQYYGLSSAGSQEFTVTDLTGTAYGGILTHGAVMTQHAFGNSSSPIHRGVMVRERILCQELPPPPPGIIVQVPALDEGLTTRERFQAHSQMEPCLSCHQLIDPIGFAFENFDGVGLLRSEENGKPIDVSGEIKGSISSDAVFTGVGELAATLGESEEVQACFALHWYRFAYGLDNSSEMNCLVRKVQDDFKGEDADIQQLILNLTQSEHFVRRVADEPETPPAEGEGEGEGLPPQPLLVETVIQSQWDTGYCADIFVTNEGTESLVWEFTMPVDGEIVSLWNANSTPAGDQLHFTGVDWNGTLEPGETAQFGFCASI